jgi:hypothetical protein
MTINYDELKPGRDLDALVAKMKGWTDIDWHFDRTWPGEQWMGGNPFGDQERYVEEVPHFSTDIAAALEGVEELDELYIEWSKKGWFVMIGEDFDTATRSSTLPHAICIARLKAAEVPG